jgi:hypothetical protein
MRARNASNTVESLLATINDLEALVAWFEPRDPDVHILASSVRLHLSAARTALTHRRSLTTSIFERATSNIDAAAVGILAMAPADYVLSQLPELVAFVAENLESDDPRRIELERIAGHAADGGPLTRDDRGVVVTTIRSAYSTWRRTYIRFRSFRTVVNVTTACLAMLALGAAVTGAIYPLSAPLCSNPDGKIVCPTAAASFQGGDLSGAAAAVVSQWDYIVVEAVGLMGAALAAAGTLRQARATSAPYGIPVALAFLKLPTGALLAILGVLTMRAQWLIGLSPVRSSAQILACALLFGYGQQILTRPVDEQGGALLAEGNPETSGMRARRIVSAWYSAVRPKSSD